MVIFKRSPDQNYLGIPFFPIRITSTPFTTLRIQCNICAV